MNGHCAHGHPQADCALCWKLDHTALGDTCAFGTCTAPGVQQVASTYRGRIADWRLMCDQHAAFSLECLGAVTATTAPTLTTTIGAAS